MNEEEKKWLEEFNKSEPRQTSYSGRRCYSEFANPDKIVSHRFDIDKLNYIGGNRLVVLYLCGSNYELAAKELGIKQKTLRKYIERLRKVLADQNIGKERLKKFLMSQGT